MSAEQLTQRKNKHILQRLAKIVGIISIIVALICAGYLLTLTDSEDKVMKAFYGSISFFCFLLQPTIGVCFCSLIRKNLFIGL